MCKICFIDVETTGTDPKLHAVTQLAGIICVPGIKGNGVTFNYKIKPHDSAVLDAQALLITGESQETFATYDPPSTVLCDFTRTLDKVISKYDRTDKLFFIGYNANFDDQFLRSFFIRQGHKFYGSYFWWPPIDVAQMAQLYLMNRRHTLMDFRLGTVYKAITKKDLLFAHDAMADINATREIYEIMMEDWSR